MPTFEFTSPQGKTFQITGPEGSTAEQAFSHFQAAQPELFAAPAEAPAAAVTEAPAGEGIPAQRRGPMRVPSAAFASRMDPAKEYLGEMAMNAPGNAADVIGGIAGAVTSPFDTTTGLVKGAYNIGQGLGAKVAVPAAEAYLNYQGRGPAQGIPLPAAALEEAKVAQAPVDAAIQHVTDKYGSLDKFAETLKKEPVTTMMDLSMLLGGAGGAAKFAGATDTGALLARAGEVTNPMALAAPGIAAAAGKVGEGVTGVRNALSPMVGALTPALEGRGEQYVNALRNPANLSAVPGANLTAGEVLAGAGPGVSGTQLPALQTRLASEVSPTAFAERAAQNKAAQVASIGTIAQTPEELTAAAKARTAVSSPDYVAADTKIVPSDTTFNALAQTPDMQDAISTAKRNAANLQRPFQIGETAPAGEVATGLKDVNGNPIMRQTPATNASYSGENLHDVKIALDDMINKKESADGTALKDTEVRTLQEVRNQFLDWFENKVPEYKSAREKFATASEPINTMKVGQVLKEALTSPLSDEATRPGVFAGAVRNAPQTLKKATGPQRFQELTDVLSPGDMSRVNAVMTDMARTDAYQKLARAGSTATKGVPNIEIPKSPGFLSVVATTANKIAKTLEGRINDKLAIQIADAMLNPETAAALIENTMGKAAKNKAVGEAIKTNTAKAINALRGAAPTLNALAPSDQ